MIYFKHRVLSVREAVRAKDDGYHGVEIDVRRARTRGYLIACHECHPDIRYVALSELLATCYGLNLMVILDIKENGLFEDFGGMQKTEHSPIIMGVPGQEAENWAKLARKRIIRLTSRSSEYEFQQFPDSMYQIIDSFKNEPMPLISNKRGNIFIGPDLRGKKDYEGSLPEFTRTFKYDKWAREDYCVGMITDGESVWKP